jgi:hypothetical protein
MRFLLVIAIWVVMVGGLSRYIAWRDRAVAAPVAELAAVRASAGEFSLEVTPTFSLEEDPFALQTGEAPVSALEVRLNGRPLAIAIDDMHRGRPFTLAALEGVQAGRNEIHVQASPPVAENSLVHGLRIRVIDRDAVLVDDTVWGGGGALVSGTVGFATMEKEAAGHDH